MAQGLIKTKSKAKASSGSSKTSSKVKKGSRTIAPRRSDLAKQAKRNRKLTGSLINDTEKMLGARAGHLEMLGKSESDKLKDGKKNGTGKEKFGGKSNPKPKVNQASI